MAKNIVDNIYQIARCPDCNSEMKKIQGRYGEFYACSQFRNGCKGKRTVKDVEVYGNGLDIVRVEEEPVTVATTLPETRGQAQVDVPTDDKDGDLVSTKEYPYLKFKFEKFNPVQSKVFKIYDEDANCVIASSTSSGKTIMGEMIMADAIKKGKKALFLSPLKAVSQEKNDDWNNEEHGFAKEGVSIVTGDYALTTARKEELEKAKVVILTTEMLDHRTRNISSEKSEWLLNANVCVIDECFLGGTKVLVEDNFSVKIEDIYNNEKITHVLSYNEETKILEKKKIVRRIRNEKKGHLVTIKYQVGDEIRNLVCTPNHKIWTTKGYKRADALTNIDIIKIFFEEDNYNCKKCDKQFDTKLKFVNHYLINHIRENWYSFKCEECEKVFARKCDLEYHKNHFHTETNIRCEICDEKFNKEDTLSRHLKTNHSDNDVITCEICNKLFKSFKTLKTHLLRIHKQKYFEYELFCKECDIQFNTKAELSNHVKWKHNDEFIKSYYKSREKIDYVELTKKRLETMKENGSLQKFSERMKANNPMANQSSIDKMKNTCREIWDNKTEEEKDKVRENWMKDPLRGRGSSWKITSLEQKIIDLNIPEIAYTGDGKFWINIGKKENGKPWNKNPDFKIRGQRKVIEVGDIEHWHTLEEIEKTVKAYEATNFKCLYLTNKDLAKEDYKERVITFVKNHDAKVISVKKYGNKFTDEAKYVYNLEVEDHHNYVANNVLVSNCHLITMKGRGDKVESALMRFTKQNPSCRIVLLSATMPNVSELANWLTKLNGKKTNLINSSYRPCTLDIHYESYLDKGSYIDQRDNKITKAIDLINHFPQDKFICFVHDKTTGKMLIDALSKDGTNAEFHSADIGLKDRVRIEQAFKSRDKSSLRVLVATSTLAWGCNVPARRVVILGLHRGMNEVEPLDIKQMAGRAGRLLTKQKYYAHLKNDTTKSYTGINILSKQEVMDFQAKPDEELIIAENIQEVVKQINEKEPAYFDNFRGDAHILLPRGKKDYYQRWCEVIPFITSTFNDPDILAFHIVSEIADRSVYNVPTLVDWFNRSFAAFKGHALDAVEAKKLFDRLEKFCIVEKQNEKYTITSLGHIASSLYFSPYSVAGWCFNFNKVFEKGLEKEDMAISWALANIYENSQSFVPKEIITEVKHYMNWCESKGLKISDKGAVTALSYLACLKNSYFDIGRKTMIKFDFDRIVTALKAVDTRFACWKKEGYWKTLATRIKYEVTAEQAVLCGLEGIGGAYARKLYQGGIRTIDDFKNKAKTARIILGDKIYEKAAKHG